MKKSLQFVTLALVMSMGAAGAFAADSDFPKTHIQMIGTSAGSPPWLITETFWKNISKKTGGKLDASVQSMTELGIKGQEVFRMAKLGVVNIVSSSLAYSSGDIAENDAVDFTGFVPNLDVMKKAVQAYRPTLEKIYADKLGLKLLGMWPLAAQVFWCAVPISGIEDLKGKKIRVSGATRADLVRSMGGTPTTLPFAEVVPALQRKVIDCGITGTAAGNIANWTEVTTHLYPLVVAWGMEAQAANLKWWNGLDPRVQDLIQEKMDEMAVIGWQQAEAGTNNGIWCSTGDPRCDVTATEPKKLKKKNLTLVPVSKDDVEKLRKLAIKDALPKFAKRCGKACIENFNKVLGPIFGAKAPVPDS